MKRTAWQILAAAIWLVSTVASSAQSPTPDQLEILRNLTPEQQSALLEELVSEREAAGESDSPFQDSLDQAPSTDADDSRRRPELREPQTPRVVVTMQPGDTVLVEASLDEEDAEELSPIELERSQQIVEMIRTRNPFELDRSAQLNLPGFAPIALSGLTERQASQRLELEPALLSLEVRIIRLPLVRTGVLGLKRFGYDLFDNAPSTFSPVTDVPVPADYVLGAGDELNVQLFGSDNRNFTLSVSRDGVISFPELGPIRVGGMTFNAARRSIEARVAQQMIGVQASVAMGDTRSIRVFVMGDARLPGSYTVSGLATMTTALFASGGVQEIGSLRDIQLKRQGAVVRRLDLYDLLVGGDTSDDAKLLPGDVIFIPPVGPTVSVDGEVKRPAIYELRNEATVADAIRIAGGLTPEADAARVNLTRIDAGARRVVMDIDLRTASPAGQRMGNGDVLRVARLRPQVDAGVELEGFVYRPGPVAWRNGLRLTEVIGSVDELRPNADQNYVLIRREAAQDRRVSFVSADLAAALAAPGTAADVPLMARDRIIVFDLAPGRERIIRPLLDELRLQSQLARPTAVVRVTGRVKAPGEYPLEPDMRVSDLIRAGGNLDAGAFGGEAELTRYVVDAEGTRQTELVTIDLAALSRGEATADVALRPYDYLVIKETPNWTGQESVTLRGEVRFPGTFPISRGETLRQLMDRAGGLTPLAFPEGSAFTRVDLEASEQRQLDRLAERMRSDLAALSLQAANAGRADASEALISGQALVSQLQSATATGRYVIDLPGLLRDPPGGPLDVVLKDGDVLVIPEKRQEVTVIGEIQNPASLQFLPNLNRADYVAMSGGTTAKADRKRIYVVRADGRVATQNQSRLARNYDVAIKPGDTIVVPLDTERMPRLPFWQAVTQILYNVAVSVAAVNSF